MPASLGPQGPFVLCASQPTLPLVASASAPRCFVCGVTRYVVWCARSVVSCCVSVHQLSPRDSCSIMPPSGADAGLDWQYLHHGGRWRMLLPAVLHLARGLLESADLAARHLHC